MKTLLLAFGLKSYFGCSKGSSSDCSNEYPQHMLWLKSKSKLHHMHLFTVYKVLTLQSDLLEVTPPKRLLKILSFKVGFFLITQWKDMLWVHALGTQKNRLTETVLMSTHTICFC